VWLNNLQTFLIENILFVHVYYKGQELLGPNAKRVKYIHTSASGAACGLNLNKGRTYLLSGRVHLYQSQLIGCVTENVSLTLQTFTSVINVIKGDVRFYIKFIFTLESKIFTDHI
jgi:hypothetical protein